MNPSTTTEPYPRRWAALAVLLAAAFMNMIDVSIVNVALPSLQSSLGASSSEIEWVVAGYVLAFALALLPFGRLGDRVGRKRMFMLGVAGFTLFSALCGLAPTTEVLIGSRVLQGITGAMMMPQVLAIAQVMFSPRERAYAFSFFGLTAGLGSVAGPLVGGLLIGGDFFGLDWRPIFLVNIPIGIAVLLLARNLVPATEQHPNLTNDWGGIAIAATAILLVIFPLIEGHTLGWPAWAFGMIAAGIVTAGIFAVYEKRRAARDLSQLLPASLLRNGNFMLGSGMLLIFFSGSMGLFLFLAIFLQQGFGFTPLAAGLTTVPFPLGVLVASLLNGRIGSRWHRQRIAIGALMLLTGMYYLRTVILGVGDMVDHWSLAAPLLLAGLGMGVAIAPMMQTALASVQPRDAGSGAGALQSVQQLGSAFGIAIAGQIFFSTLTTSFTTGAQPHPAFISALSAALIYCICAYVAVIVLVMFLKPPAMHDHGAAEGQRAPQPIAIEA
jgi:EmrB/QacA subfamily drug resistance transporter